MFADNVKFQFPGLLSAAVNPLAGHLLESSYWFYRYHYTILPVLLMLPVFVLLGCAIPAIMYRQASKQSVVERLREAEGSGIAIFPQIRYTVDN